MLHGDFFLGNALIDMLGKCMCIDGAAHVFLALCRLKMCLLELCCVLVI